MDIKSTDKTLGESNTEMTIPEWEYDFLHDSNVKLPKKKLVTMRLDIDVLDWFKSHGPGYQTRINKLLRSYMEAHRG